jgi:hypothetical protein
MRAVGLMKHGGPEVLQVLDVPEVHAWIASPRSFAQREPVLNCCRFDRDAGNGTRRPRRNSCSADSGRTGVRSVTSLPVPT